MKDWKAIHDELMQPLPAEVVKQRVGSTTARRGDDKRYPPGTKGQVLHYIDARNAMDRLDEVAGPDCWQDAYTVLFGQKGVDSHITIAGPVECRLTVTGVSSEGAILAITHTDVGYPNSDSSPEPLKDAYSDALKRAAVKFGLGRFLYDLPSEWREIDEWGHFKDGSTRSQASRSGGTGGGHSDKPPTNPGDMAGEEVVTSAQQRYIEEGLRKDLDWTPEELNLWILDNTGAESVGELTKGQASSVITKMKELKHSTPPVEPVEIRVPPEGAPEIPF